MQTDTPVEVFGNVARRKVILKAGETFPAHSHNYAHAHVLVTGTIVARVCVGDEVSEREYTAPAMFELPAIGDHELHAKTDAEGWCVFAVRDEDGGVAYEPTEAQKSDYRWSQAVLR